MTQVDRRNFLKNSATAAAAASLVPAMSRHSLGQGRDLLQIMWEKFVAGIAGSTAGSGLDVSKVMPTSGHTIADWQVLDTAGLPQTGGNPPKVGDLVAPALEQWANVMPQWAPNYSPSANNIYDLYTAYLRSIALRGGNPALQQIANSYGNRVGQAVGKHTADKRAMYAAWKRNVADWKDIPVSARPTFQQWYAANWAGVLRSDENQFAAETQKFNQTLAAVGGPDYRTVSSAHAKATLAAAAGNALRGPGGILYPAYSVSPSLNNWYVSALRTLSDGSPPQIKFTITLDDSNSSSQTTSAYLKGASYSEFCWGGSAAASYSQSKGAQKYSSLVPGLSMTYSAQAATTFSFGLGPWYDSAMVSGFYDQISGSSSLANKKMFGPSGFLNVRAARVLVVLKPSIVLSGNRQRISSLATQFQQQSGASLSVGGFCWSASDSISRGSAEYTNDVRVSADGMSLTLTDNTNNPKVVLVIPANFAA